MVTEAELLGVTPTANTDVIAEDAVDAADEAVTEAEAEAEAEVEVANDEVNEIAQLRSTLRDMMAQNAELANEVAKVKATPAQLPPVPEPAAPAYRILWDENGDEVKIPIPSDVKVAPEVTEKTEETVTNYDKLQKGFTDVLQSKAPLMDTLKATMELSPKYADLNTVVTQAAAEDLFDKLAVAAASAEGVSQAEALLMVKTAVWKLPNPYDYLYTKIKEFNPAPKVASPAVPPVVPASVGNLPGTDVSKSGWSAEKISALDVDDLINVPKDVYAAYMQGTLK